MLARLSEVPNLVSAHCDVSGSTLLLEVRDADAQAAAARVVGSRLRAVLEPAEAEVQLASRRAGEPWFAADQLLALSLLEARILGQRISTAVAAATDLAPEATHRLAETSRAVLAATFTRVHAEGGRASTSWFFAEWPDLARAIAAAAATWLAPTGAAPVAEALARLFARTCA
ncbi:MAG: hypothetical protein IT370_05455 [Deltaproteobacteria bacterium]|nr:hypothetical protein [Deltaproteobacteria bacterium]